MLVGGKLQPPDPEEESLALAEHPAPSTPERAADELAAAVERLEVWLLAPRWSP